ncbi:glycosyltransferase family 61 protein [Nocardioides panzhihuensis]|uniref:Glycosyltransferase 61 catalytic domain-containing protein n=1 Tax=Nocardioides panzhihuensis TaxID=860243 RepID=A0A7Z0DIP1_9ACTN|nr:glycosyltransferase family 61 protein [Nocardioides panzhihuensis]NYI76315.1 hypothetical protein [Nocardioides panzhihuensis]
MSEERIQQLIHQRDVDAAAAMIIALREGDGTRVDDGIAVAVDALLRGAGGLLESRLMDTAGGLDRPGFNAAVRHLCFYGLGDIAQELVDLVENRGLLAMDDLRLEDAKRVIDGVNARMGQFEKLVESGAYERVQLIEAREFERRPMPERLPLSADADLICYQQGGTIETHPSTFEADFAGLPESQRAALRAAGFDRDFNESDIDRVFVARDVRFCVSDEDVATAFTADLRTRAARASRYAKANSTNVAAPVRTEIPRAYVLPFAHNYVNYYHLMAETAAGLSGIHRVPHDTPIVYVEDRFGVLPFAFERLGLDPARLVSARELETTQVACAYWPDPPPYLWSRRVFDLFGSMTAVDVDPASRRIYVSRTRSPRSFTNEAAVEEMMSDLGFRIVYAEDLTLAEQASAFGSADLVVAPHGAGLTNLAFARAGVKVVELFPDNFVKPDFYLRSKQIGARYRCQVVHQNTVDLRLLQQLVGEARRPWAPAWLASWPDGVRTSAGPT